MSWQFDTYLTVADPDLELRGGRGGGGGGWVALDFLAPLVLFPSVISSFFYPK